MQASRSRCSAANVEIETIAQRLAGKSHARHASYERDFAGLLTLLSPRIAGLIRQYRLDDMYEDAHQAAALGVHRALTSYNSDKASFGTHATWQIRGELQSLRHRMRLDQRASARNAGVTTVSLDAHSDRVADAPVLEIVDEAAERRAERSASDTMALSLMDRLLEQLRASGDERKILHCHLLDRDPEGELVGSHTSEQRRQIVRRTFRNCRKVMAI